MRKTIQRSHPDLDCGTSFSGAAGPDDADERRVLDEIRYLSDHVVAPDERRELAREVVLRCDVRFRGARGARTAGRIFELSPRFRREGERIGDSLERRTIRRFTIAALERADRLHADECAVCERLLRKAGLQRETSLSRTASSLAPSSSSRWNMPRSLLPVRVRFRSADW